MRALTLAAGLALAGLPAQAVTMQAVYSGTIEAGSDAGLYFDAPQTNLAGMPAVLTVLYDLDFGTRTTTTTSDELVGGPDTAPGGTSPILGVFFQIVGEEIFRGNLAGAVKVTAGESRVTAAFDYQTQGVSYVGQFGAAVLAQGLPVSLTAPFVATGSGSDPFGLEPFQANRSGGGLPDASVVGTFAASGVTVSVYQPPGVAPVPVPAAMPMLLAGLTGLALVARRRPRQCLA